MKAKGQDIDIKPGQVFDQLTYLGEVGIREYKENSSRIVRCRCSCGRIVEILASTLMLPRRHRCRSCSDNAHRIDCSDIRAKNPRLWGIYNGMYYRCYRTKPGTSAYRNYRGRGISICNEWKNSFASFVNWSLNNGYKSNLSIDRIDFNGNYEPSNCRWADSKTQANNTRNNVKNQTSEWKALKFRKAPKVLLIEDEWYSFPSAAEHFGIPIQRIRARFKKGYRGAALVCDKIPQMGKCGLMTRS